ncbi:MAG TPA: succinate dehydrogenase, cytochrome b556 subunit [Roseiflexaceae bacterium]|nr:succinate dehydrogenase, cytochrome b556 subunit [Roseiflexaceae bacterium]
MSQSLSRRSYLRAARWFDPRWRSIGTWAFILNRVSGLGLTLYLFLHLGVLGLLARGPESYDRFVTLAKSPLLVLGELLVIAAGLYHGLNGLRVAFSSFGVGVAYQKPFFYALLLLVCVMTGVFAWRMLFM